MKIEDPTRRTFLKASATVAFAPMLGCSRVPDTGVFVTDVAQLERMEVAEVVCPESSQVVAETLRQGVGPISIGGCRFSMGGQIAAPDSRRGRRVRRQ
jgi:hypothetical protein